VIAPPPIPGVHRRKATRIALDGAERLELGIADEVPVALVYNGISHAVMMATPADLEDFALGFSLTEGILDSPDDLLESDLVETGPGWEVRLTIPARRFATLQDRRRGLAGRSGCGLCGIESLEAAMRPPPVVADETPVRLEAIRAALAALPSHQLLNRLAGAVHAAAWANPEGEILEVCEDVGRHNALDKLIGRLARRAEGRPPGFLILTSRCSYELVTKAAMVGIPILVAISAPTGLALDTAEAAGLTIVALARRDSVTVYTHPRRVLEEVAS
jgi:formate dehydrogenase accessory protein FdhD